MAAGCCGGQWREGLGSASRVTPLGQPIYTWGPAQSVPGVLGWGGGGWGFLLWWSVQSTGAGRRVCAEGSLVEPS